MFSKESRRARRSGNDRRRPCPAAFESLEGRELLAYSVLGSSLPDLVVSGFASPVASWGGPVTVTVDVRNIGASTTVEPLSLAPGSVSSADSGPFNVTVYAARNARNLNGAVPVGTINIASQAQNSEVQTSSTLTLPQQPRGFPGDGGKIYLVFLVNSSGSVLESDATNNFSRPVPLTIEAPLPELAVVGLDLPPVMQPGDTVQPNIRIANLGPADTLPQGPVTIDLVASTTPTFNSGSSIVARYTVANIPGESQVASRGSFFGDANLIPQNNVVTLAGDPVTLPTSPAVYYVGVVIDPSNQLKQLQRVPQFSRPANPFSLSHKVGPPIPGLPPAGVLVAGGVSLIPQFPIPFGNNPIGGTTTGVFPAPYPPQSLFVYGFDPAATTTTTTGGGTGGGLTLSSLSAGKVKASAVRALRHSPTAAGRLPGPGGLLGNKTH